MNKTAVSATSRKKSSKSSTSRRKSVTSSVASRKKPSTHPAFHKISKIGANSLPVELSSSNQSSAIIEEALIDTGASCCIMPEYVAKYLGLKINYRDKPKLLTATGCQKTQGTTFGSVMILGKKFYKIKFLLFELPDETCFKIVLGRNFLKRVKLTIDGPNDKLTIE